MKNILLSKSAKIIVDILLLLAFVIFFVLRSDEITKWNSAHCIFSSFWILLMLIHVLQHKKSDTKSKLTALTTIGFALLFISVLLFCIRFNTFFLTFHKIAGILFILLIIIHTISKSKQFITLFKRENPSS